HPEWFASCDLSGCGLFEIPPGEPSGFGGAVGERRAAFESAWQGGGFHLWASTFIDIGVNLEANRLAYEFWREKTRARVADPVTAEKLAPEKPPHPFGTKRPSLEQWYYEVFNRDNVALVDVRDEPIAEITPTAVRTELRHYPLDLLVLATGFHATTGGLTQIDIRGLSGRTLEDTWKSGVQTHLGIGIPNFPNLLMLYGPQSPTAFCNGPTCAELQGDWVADCLCHLRDHGLTRIAASAAARRSWPEQLAGLAARTLLPLAESWYMGANIPGKPRQLLHHNGLQEYLACCRESAENGYAGFELSARRD